MSISSRAPRALLSWVLVSVAAPSLFAQKVIHVFSGDDPLELAGFSVSDLGDVDGDGVPDVLVGAPGAQADGDLAPEGRAVVLSGADGTPIREWFGTDDLGLFGQAVAGVGDVDQDGRPDVLIGAPAAVSGTGQVTGAAFLHSGFDGSLIRSFHGDEELERFGAAVHAAGDVDQDGVPDVIVGGPGATPNGIESGRAVVYSGATGDPLRTFFGDSAG
ncbi:MAG: integrin alpha, partial [Planctomycetota bacterium JB042]